MHLQYDRVFTAERYLWGNSYEKHPLLVRATRKQGGRINGRGAHDRGECSGVSQVARTRLYVLFYASRLKYNCVHLYVLYDTVSKHMSLYTTHTIIQHSLDDLMRRLVNQGLIRHFSTESAQAMRVRRVTASAAAASASQQCGSSSITVHELRSIGVLVVLGLFASVLVFGLELLVKRLSLQRRG